MMDEIEDVDLMRFKDVRDFKDRAPRDEIFSIPPMIGISKPNLGWLLSHASMGETFAKSLAIKYDEVDNLNEVLLKIYRLTDNKEIERLIEENTTPIVGWTGGGE